MSFGRFIASLLILNLLAVAGLIVVVSAPPAAPRQRPAAVPAVTITNVVWRTNR